MTPVYYSNKNENKYMTGYRSSLKSSTLGSIRNELDFFRNEEGVKLEFQVIIDIYIILVCLCY
jgi:hypothetical protein